MPPLRRLPPGQLAAPFTVEPGRLGFDSYDLLDRTGTSHHYRRSDDGSIRYATGNFRDIWLAECDLMARLAGMELESRWADWSKAPFTSDSESHVSVWRRP